MVNIANYLILSLTAVLIACKVAYSNNRPVARSVVVNVK